MLSLIHQNTDLTFIKVKCDVKCKGTEYGTHERNNKEKEPFIGSQELVSKGHRTCVTCNLGRNAMCYIIGCCVTR